MATAQQVINRARNMINDVASGFVAGLRWSDTELLRWISDGQREIVELEPEANIVTDVFDVVGGIARQSLDPLSAYRLIRVEANGASGPPTPTTPVLLNDHTIVARGHVGTGTQQPGIIVDLKGFYGAFSNQRLGFISYYTALGQTIEVDGGNATQQVADPDEWWNSGSPPTLSNYQVRLTVLSGASPSYGTVNSWLSMGSSEWGWTAPISLLTDVLSATWMLEIRDANTLNVLDSGVLTITLTGLTGGGGGGDD